GSFWLRQRRIAQPAFHRERIAGFASIMARDAEQMVTAWKLGEPFDVAAHVLRGTSESLPSPWSTSASCGGTGGAGRRGVQ
ncbi:MAG: hypothetical protein ACXU85_22665, partial [Xanthobacteraceae bacterium]